MKDNGIIIANLGSYKIGINVKCTSPNPSSRGDRDAAVPGLPTLEEKRKAHVMANRIELLGSGDERWQFSCSYGSIIEIKANNR